MTAVSEKSKILQSQKRQEASDGKLPAVSLFSCFRHPVFSDAELSHKPSQGLCLQSKLL